MSPCGYALFELAKAQRGTGDPEGAVKTLEQRLQRYPDDQRAAVEAELKKAKADAGAVKDRASPADTPVWTREHLTAGC